MVDRVAHRVKGSLDPGATAVLEEVGRQDRLGPEVLDLDHERRPAHGAQRQGGQARRRGRGVHEHGIRAWGPHEAHE